MGILIGPTPWWQSLVVSTAPVGSTLPDGSRLICKAGGTAWIVAPVNTQVGQTWNNSTSTLVGNKCCVSDWPTLNTRLINCGFTPGDWFVPTAAQLQNPGFVCRCQWNYSNSQYWSSTEINNSQACFLRTDGTLSGGGNYCKNESRCVRAFRCVTY